MNNIIFSFMTTVAPIGMGMLIVIFVFNQPFHLGVFSIASLATLLCAILVHIFIGRMTRPGQAKANTAKE